VRVKVASLEGGTRSVAPEHDDCAAVAAQTGHPTSAIRHAAIAAAREEMDDPAGLDVVEELDVREGLDAW
jgi:uncharacterized protein (DUF111 family)